MDQYRKCSTRIIKRFRQNNPCGLQTINAIFKYVIDTKNLDLNFEPENITQNENQNIFALSDSDFYGYKETRISVDGFIIYLLGVPIIWDSKNQRSATLTSSELEYVALSEAAK